jgi:hypothetical protein
MIASSLVISAKAVIQTPVAFDSFCNGAPMESGLRRNDGEKA